METFIGTVSAYAGVALATLVVLAVSAVGYAVFCVVRGRREAKFWEERFRELSGHGR